MLGDKLEGPRNRMCRALIVKTNRTKDVVVRRLGCDTRLGDGMMNIVSSGPRGGKGLVRNIHVLNNERYVLSMTGGCRISRVVLTVPSTSPGMAESVLHVYGRAAYGLGVLPNVCRLVARSIDISGLESISVRSLLKESPVGMSLRDIHKFVRNEYVVMANNNNSVNDRLYHRVTGCGPSELVVFSVCRGGTCSVRRRLGLGRPRLGLAILVKSMEGADHVRSIVRACEPSIVCRTTTRGRIPLVRSDPGRTVGGGMFKACGATETTSGFKMGEFILVSASGTIGPAGVVNTSGEVYRVVVRAFGECSGARCMTMHFKGILKDGKDIVPLFGHRVTTKNPLAIARPSVVHCFVAVPRTMSLMLRTNTFTGKKRVFMLSVKRPIGVTSLTGGLVHLSKCALNISVSVGCAKLHPKRGLCRRLLMGRRKVRGASGGLVCVKGPLRFGRIRFLDKLQRLRRTTVGRDLGMGRVMSRVIPACRVERRSLGQSRRIGGRLHRLKGVDRRGPMVRSWCGKGRACDVFAAKCGEEKGDEDYEYTRG